MRSCEVLVDHAAKRIGPAHQVRSSPRSGVRPSRRRRRRTHRPRHSCLRRWNVARASGKGIPHRLTRHSSEPAYARDRHVGRRVVLRGRHRPAGALGRHASPVHVNRRDRRAPRRAIAADCRNRRRTSHAHARRMQAFATVRRSGRVRRPGDGDRLANSVCRRPLSLAEGPFGMHQPIEEIRPVPHRVSGPFPAESAHWVFVSPVQRRFRCRRPAEKRTCGAVHPHGRPAPRRGRSIPGLNARAVVEAPAPVRRRATGGRRSRIMNLMSNFNFYRRQHDCALSAKGQAAVRNMGARASL